MCFLKSKASSFSKTWKKKWVIKRLTILSQLRIPQIASIHGDLTKETEKKIRTLDSASSCDLIDRLIWRYWQAYWWTAPCLCVYSVYSEHVTSKAVTYAYIHVVIVEHINQIKKNCGAAYSFNLIEIIFQKSLFHLDTVWFA